jgi:hypothetical protein
MERPRGVARGGRLPEGREAERPAGVDDRGRGRQPRPDARPEPIDRRVGDGEEGDRRLGKVRRRFAAGDQLAVVPGGREGAGERASEPTSADD